MSRGRKLLLWGGPLTCYLAGVGCAAVLFSTAGLDEGAGYRITEVEAGFDAAGKLQPGDSILAVADTPVHFGGETDQPSLLELVEESGGRPLPVRVRRDGREIEVEVRPKRDRLPSGDRFRLGVVLDVEARRHKLPLAQAAARAALEPARRVGADLSDLAASPPEPAPDALRGPIGIAEMFEPPPPPGWVTGLELAVRVAGWASALWLLFSIGFAAAAGLRRRA